MDQATMRAMQARMNSEVEKMKALQAKLEGFAGPRSQYQSQLNENQLVRDELDILDDDDKIFKLIGPVMVKQELDDAKGNVNGRIKYFEEEIGRIDKAMEETKVALAAQENTLNDLQNVARKTQEAAMAMQKGKK